MATPAVNDLLKTTKQQENFYRLTRLLITGGTTVLRDVLDNIHQPSNLPSILAQPTIKDPLDKRTTNEQRRCLYPSPGKYGKSEDFDISLILLLLRNICSFTKKWTMMPPDSDQSLSADVERIRRLRNEVYHTTDMEILDSDFVNIWDKLSEVLIRIESNFGENKKREWMYTTQQLLTSPLTETDRQNVEELERWYVQETEIKKTLSSMELGLNEINATVGELKALHIQNSDVSAKTCFKKHHNDLPLNYFCYDCKLKSCELCARVEHRSHKVYPSDNDPELDKIRNDITHEILEAEKKLARGDDELQSLTQKLHDSKARLEIIENMVHSFVEKCVNEIRHQEHQLVKDIERISLCSSLDVDEIKSNISKHHSEIREAINCARVLLEKGDVLAICHEANAIKETLKEQSSTELVFKPLSCEKKTFSPNTTFFDDLYSRGIGRISAVDPLKCTISGPGVDLTAKLYQGLETTFTITTLSVRGEVIHAPSEELSVVVNYKLEGKITHGIFTQNVSKNVKDHRNGTYTVTYIPLKIGTAFVSVKIGRELMTGSSFEVKIMQRKYEATALIGKKGKGHGNFDGPWCAVENSKGDIYITDRDNNRVQVFNKERSWVQTIGEFGSEDGQLIQPRGIAIDRNDDVIVVDNGNNRVQVFNKDGNFKMKFGGPGVEVGRFQNPYSVALDDDHNLIISDADNQRVQIFTPDGEFVKAFGQGNINKSFYCIYHEGQYIVSDFESYCVKLFNKEGQLLHKIGKRGTRDGQFDKWIRGLAIDKVGNLLVCDSYADRIQVFRPVGDSFEFLDKFGKEGENLGKFKQPTTITVLKNGRFVVCEFHNSRVQIF